MRLKRTISTKGENFVKPCFVLSFLRKTCFNLNLTCHITKKNRPNTSHVQFGLLLKALLDHLQV